MKIKFLLLAAALTVLAVSCGNKKVSSESVETVDTTSTICDSSMVAPTMPDSSAVAPEAAAPAAEAPAEPVADPQIDAELNDFSSNIDYLQEMINNGQDGVTYFETALVNTEQLYNKLRSEQGKMTPAQKSRFQQLEYRFRHH